MHRSTHYTCTTSTAAEQQFESYLYPSKSYDLRSSRPVSLLAANLLQCIRSPRCFGSHPRIPNNEISIHNNCNPSPRSSAASLKLNMAVLMMFVDIASRRSRAINFGTWNATVEFAGGAWGSNSDPSHIRVDNTHCRDRRHLGACNVDTEHLQAVHAVCLGMMYNKFDDVT